MKIRWFKKQKKRIKHVSEKDIRKDPAINERRQHGKEYMNDYYLSSREYIKMTNKKRDQIKKAKLEYKASLKNPTRHEQERNRIIEQLVKHESPRWGSLKLIIL